MRIVIDHIARIEGHAGFIGKIVRGKIQEAKIETQEGARLFESLLIGRHYFDAPVITARICGVCPVIHNLTSIKAIENAFEITPHPITVDLRQLMLAGQIIHSHVLHLFFLVIVDFFKMESGFDFAAKYPEDAKAILELRNFGNKIIEIIGGRSIHPLTPEAGGFTKLPDRQKLEDLLSSISAHMATAKKLLKVLADMPQPQFARPTQYVAMFNESGYLPYEGVINSNVYPPIAPDKFIKSIRESETITTPSKRAKINKKTYLVGALARLNLNYNKLNKEAKSELSKLNILVPSSNSFYNNLAQGIEIIHLIEKVKMLLEKYLAESRSVSVNEINIPVRPIASLGVGALEAPRGTLFHAYSFDKDGLITSTNIITPTVQSLNNLEEDLKVWLKNHANKGDDMESEEQKRLIMMLIRAYDPCITCATH